MIDSRLINPFRKTATIYSRDIRNKDIKKVTITKKEIINTDPFDLYLKVRKLQADGYLVAFEKNPSKLDYKLIRMIYGKDVSPIFFNSQKSSAINVRYPNSFFKLLQYSNCYYMPVTLKDMSKRKESTREANLDEPLTVSYLDTSRSNINSVRAVMIDIDTARRKDPDAEQLSRKTLNDLAYSVNYFAEEANIAPTAIINSGRGLQLLYIPKVPLYRNSDNIDDLLRAFNKVVVKIIEEEVLSNIDHTYRLFCDTAINPINQKMRCPGTVNMASLTYAHTVIINEDRLYNFGEVLNDRLGSYEDYLESIALSKDKAKPKRKGNNKNGRNNLAIALEDRIAAIKSTMRYCSENYGTGFRNRSYFTWIWLATSLMGVPNNKYSTIEDLAKEICDFDSTLVVPYFKNLKEVNSLIKSTHNTMSNSKNFRLKDKSIEDECLSLIIAHRDGAWTGPFFKPTVREERIKAKIIKQNENIELKDNIREDILNQVNITSIADKHSLSRNTIYSRLKSIAKDLRISGFENTVDGLYISIKEKLLLLKEEALANTIKLYKELFLKDKNKSQAKDNNTTHKEIPIYRWFEHIIPKPKPLYLEYCKLES